MYDSDRNLLATDIWTTENKKFRYINVEKENGTCPMCKEKHNLSAHHIIPKRLKLKKSGPLGELRIRICSGCHRKIHPESILMIGLRELIKVIDDLTDGKADSIDIVKKLRGKIYNNKIDDKIDDTKLYNHLDKINESLGKVETAK